MRTNQRKHALIAGISLLIMAVAAMFAYGYVFSLIETEGDPIATWDQLRNNSFLYLAGLGAWLIIFITDLLVTVTLFYFFRETHKNLSLATAVTRFIYTLILGFALIGFFKLIPILNESGLDAYQAGNRVLAAFESFRKLWSLGLIIFGLHLLGLAYLSILNDRMPNFFGVLLIIAGLGYLLVHISRAMPAIPVETVDLIESILMFPMALGEILLAVWLIIKGGKEKNLKSRS